MLRKEEHSIGEQVKMMRIISWNSNIDFDKVATKDFDPSQRDSHSVVPSCATLPLKRKRSFDLAIAPSMDEHAVKAPADFMTKSLAGSTPSNRVADVSKLPSQANLLVPHPDMSVIENADDKVMEVDTSSSSRDCIKSKDEARLATMRQTISTQLNLEILLKHRELRLIDQELAKCQIALEQLRRCSEIPYPAMQQPSENVTVGKGPAVRKHSERYPARSPAPWGVADGPYSRHYAKWLLPDPRFDGGEPELVHTPVDQYINARSTRGHYTDFAQMVGKTSRSQRALNHASLPAGYGEVKQKPTGPMILKRKSDGKMVKLVCPDCGRHDFGSAQGFINHCRIGHQRNFASHDAAAEGCGEPIEVDGLGASKDAPLETPVMTPTPTPISAPALISASGSSIHPLVRSAHLIPKTVVGKTLVTGGCLSNEDRQTLKEKRTSTPTSPQCSQVPHLSTLMQDRGTATNLQAMVDDATTKIESADFDMEDDETTDLDSPLPRTGGKNIHPTVAGTKQPTKSSSLSGRRSVAQPTATQAPVRDVKSGSISSINTANNESLLHGFVSLLPSPTNESTQAPSLIDDDEEMDPQSPPSSDEIDENDIPFHVRDDEHLEDAHELRGHELQTPTTTCVPDIIPSQTTSATTTNYTNNLNSNKKRQPSFVRETVNTEGQNNTKRRKIGEQ